MNRILALFVSLGLLSGIGYGQSVNATLRGTVRDSSGAVIRGAAVTVINVEKGITRTLTSGDSGDYVAPQLPAQTYSITVAADGFQPQTHSNFVLQVDQEARLDFTLEVGKTSQAVFVTDVAPLIQSEDASTGAVIDEQRVKELPLNGRQFFQLAQLVPQVINPPQNSTLYTRGGFNVAGNPETNNNFLLDGIDDNDRTTGQPSVRPSIDGIREFKVVTGVPEAEYGRQSGGQIIISTRSGSNEFHATAFEFFRNNNLDSRNFFSLGDLPPFTRNQYGASAGGPIRRNRTFFFATYEGLRFSQTNVVAGTVPTAAFESGNFSALSTALRDPATGQPFPGNIIPAQDISGVSKALLKYWPAALLPGLTSNYVNSTPATERLDQFSARLDQVVSAKNNLFFTYQYFNIYDFSPSTIPGFGLDLPQLAQHAAVNDVHIFSPGLINELRLGFNRYTMQRLQQDAGAGDLVAQLGLPQGGPYGLPSSDGGNGGLSSISITGISGLGAGSATPQARQDNTYNLVDALTWTHGAHTVKFGADIWDFRKHSFFQTNGRGTFSFNGQFTGNAFADFLLGDLRSTSMAPGDPNQHPYQKQTGLYVQDEWKVLPSLTLNFGVRYELFFPQQEAANKISEFDFADGTLLTGTGAKYAVNPATGLPTQVGTDNIGNTLWRFPHKNFAPRFGFAWRLGHDNRTVVRGGYGIFYDALVIGNGLYVNFGLGAPFVLTETFTNSPSNVVATWANPFPAGTAIGGVNVNTVNPNLPTPYLQQWSFGIQRELARNLLLDVDYQGSKGTHLPLSYNVNQPTPGAGAVQARRPYPQWASISYFDDVSKSSYNSLTARLERRFANGLTFVSSFAYGKSLDLQDPPSTSSSGNAGVQNPLNLAAEWALSDFDVRFRSVSNFVYDLPFGKGRRWISSAPRLLDFFAGGWEATGILTLQTGRPFSVVTSKDISNTTGNNRPFLVGDPNLSDPTIREWFNTAAFSNTLPGVGYAYGNVGRNTLTSPGLRNFDLGLFKNFAITERGTLQFRAEAFNALNHANLGLPNNDANSPAFGQITQTLTQNRDIQFGLKLIF